MSALTYKQVLEAAEGKPATPEIRACLRALSLEDNLAEFLPMLRQVHRALADDNAMTQGRLVVRAMRAKSPEALATWVALATARKRKLSFKHALSLQADCCLALADWVLAWNRRQLRVA